MFKAYPRQSIYHSLNELFLLKDLFFSNKAKNGKYIKKFEKKIALLSGKKHCVLLSSARIGLYYLLKELDFEKGSEIIIPAYTFHIVPNIVQLCGYKPVFVDCEKDSDNIDIDEIEKNINSNTKAIIPTHILGNICHIEKIKKLAEKYGLITIEDCAHSLGGSANGKKSGSFGDYSYFSFGMGKNIDCMGGGALCSNNIDTINKIREIIEDFSFPTNKELLFSFFNSCISFFLSLPIIFTFFVYPIILFFHILNNDIAHNALKEEEKLLTELPENIKRRFSNVQAVLGYMQLKKFDEIKKKKIKNALLLRDKLKDVKGIKIPKVRDDAENLFLLPSFYSKHKDYIRKELIKNGIDSKGEYQFLCSQMKMFKAWKKECKNAKKIIETEFILPGSIYLNEKDILKIAKTLKNILNKRNLND